MGISTAVIKAKQSKSGVYKVVEATEKGLSDIRANTREEFNGLLTEADPLKGRRILVQYKEGAITLEP